MSPAWPAWCRVDGTFARSAIQGFPRHLIATASSVRGPVPGTASVTVHSAPSRETLPRTSCDATSPVMSKTRIPASVKPATATC